MADKDLFAPPTKDEMNMAQSGLRTNNDLFAPPSHEELKNVGARPDPFGFHRIADNPTQDDKRQALQGLGQMADYGAGVVRTGLASSAGLVTGKGLLPGTQPVVSEQDVSDALHGHAPSSEEYYKRLGVPEGPSLKGVPIIGAALPNINARDALGFATDVVTDPLTHGMKGVKALSPLSEGAESVGKSAYKSGFKKIDEKLLEKGKAPLSDMMLEKGVTGSTKEIGEAAKDVATKATAERAQLYDKADKLGVTVDMGFPLQNAEEHLLKMRKNPGQREMADKLGEFMDLYKKEGKAKLSDLSDWKSSLYNSLPESAFSPNGKLKGPAKQFEKALASDFKEAIVEAGNKAEPGMGNAIDKLNEQLGTVISAEKPIAQQVGRGNTVNLGTSVDAILAKVAPQALAVKKGADIAKTTYARTKAGKGLMNAGRSGLLDAGARRGLINANRPQNTGLLQPRGGLLSGDE